MERINKKNLKRTREHIANVSGSMIRMENYRDRPPTKENPKCNSIGCIIGHATILDAKNVRKNFTYELVDYELVDYELVDTHQFRIEFTKWSEEFFGIGRKSHLWGYLFGQKNINIKDYHLYRMDYILSGNKAPNTIGLFYCEYGFFEHYDDGYFIPKGMKL